eukprot:SAG11_NODE_1559_length_4675_cov_4.453493_1_plen_217_part_00
MFELAVEMSQFDGFARTVMEHSLRPGRLPDILISNAGEALAFRLALKNRSLLHSRARSFASLLRNSPGKWERCKRAIGWHWCKYSCQRNGAGLQLCDTNCALHRVVAAALSWASASRGAPDFADLPGVPPSCKPVHSNGSDASARIAARFVQVWKTNNVAPSGRYRGSPMAGGLLDLMNRFTVPAMTGAGIAVLGPFVPAVVLAWFGCYVTTSLLP